MFSTLGLFNQLPCPVTKCERVNCPFSHIPVKSPSLPVDDLKHFVVTEKPGSSTSQTHPAVTGKRPISPSMKEGSNRPVKIIRTERHNQPSTEPRSSPRASVASTQPTATSITSVSTSIETMGSSSNSCVVTAAEQKAPVISANPMTSKIPLAIRQTMLSTLYKVFLELYRKFHQDHPELAHRHAVQQEEEIYAKTNKISYKNAMISSIASVKKRPAPDTPSHPSVGSEGQRAKQKQKQKPKNPTTSYNLILEDVEPLILDVESMQRYGIPTEVPSIPGGTRPHEYGGERTCDRCTKNAIIKHDSGLDACQFHWGRPMKTSTGGRKVRIYGCCSAPYPSSTGCQTGPHVFVEKEIEELHSRHAFSHTSLVESDSVLDIATLDCEGMYTTQGMSIARVSVCDGQGKIVFDELIRPDPGVEVIDFNTRFSGVTSLESAVFDLAGIRRALDALIGPKTVIIGHSIENDLMMLRMIHPRLVDTVVLYPHPSGFPYRRALRTLAQEYLSRSIQTGGDTVGHSSAEDALATLDLVKHYVLDQKSKKQRG